MDVHVTTDPYTAAAVDIAAALELALRERGEAFLALSGGSTAPPMIAALVGHDLAWERIGVWQVDERVAPDGHPDRNAEQLAPIPGRVHPMPVTDPDLEQAAAHYGAALPDRFDVVHLGIGPDGHTASWPPDQPDVATRPEPVAVTAEFNGWPRMTLTAGVVNAARRRVVLTTGADKADVVARWIDGDAELPATHLALDDCATYLDPDAGAGLEH